MTLFLTVLHVMVCIFLIVVVSVVSHTLASHLSMHASPTCTASFLHLCASTGPATARMPNTSVPASTATDRDLIVAIAIPPAFYGSPASRRPPLGLPCIRGWSRVKRELVP